MQKWTSVAEAKEFILSRVRALSGDETVAVRDSLGRVLAADIIAPFHVPGHDNSAMDGVAARFGDLNADAETALAIIGDSFAGRPFGGEVRRGQCIKIMTGAQVPPDCDIIVPQEETRPADEAGAVVILPGERKRGQHLRSAGEDLRQGECALAAGTWCTPAVVGLAASLGLGEVRVKRRLRAAFFSTGDELRKLGEPLATGEIYDSNRYTLHAMLRRLEFETLDLGAVADDKEKIAAVLDAAKTADVAISSGGASVGEADYIRPLLAERGECLFWKVAMRPGRPLAYGKLADADFFGLPGNPVSVMVCFYQILLPALWKRAGRTDYSPPPLLSAIAESPLKKARGRMEFQRAMVSCGDDGQWRVRSVGDQGSGILSSMTRGNCFIVLPEEREKVAAGESVSVQMFEGLI